MHSDIRQTFAGTLYDRFSSIKYVGKSIDLSDKKICVPKTSVQETIKF